MKGFLNVGTIFALKKMIEIGGEKMRKFILVSHGTLADGVKNSVELISGKQKNLISFSMKEGQGPVDLKQKIKSVLNENKSHEIVLISDFPGGSVNTLLMEFLQYQNVYLVSGMNSMLVLSMILNQADIATCIKAGIKAGKATIKQIKIEQNEQEDDFFD